MKRRIVTGLVLLLAAIVFAGCGADKGQIAGEWYEKRSDTPDLVLRKNGKFIMGDTSDGKGKWKVDDGRLYLTEDHDEWSAEFDVYKLKDGRLILSDEDYDYKEVYYDQSKSEREKKIADIEWTIDEAGTLFISGKGGMPDYQAEDAPWYSESKKIRAIEIENGITRIGNYAFYYLYGVKDVAIPSSVVSVGQYSFCYCQGLKSLVLPSSVSTIEEGAFLRCSGLNDITLSPELEIIEERAFEECYGLTKIFIPKSMVLVERSAFYFCVSITDVYYEDTQDRFWKVFSNIGNDPVNAEIHYEYSEK